MKRQLVIDCDVHTMEPLDLWEKHLPEPWRSKTRIIPIPPRDGQMEQAGLEVEIDGQHWPLYRSGDLELVASQSKRRMAESPELAEATIAPTPELYLKAMDKEGIDIAVLMPTFCFFLVRVDGIDPEHALAMCRVYNDYAYEFCQKNPERLKFWAWVPPHDPHLAAREARRCVQDLGAVGVAMSKGAVNGKLLSDEFFYPLWEEIERLNVPFGLHGLSGGDLLVDNIARRYHRHERTGLTIHSLLAPFYAHTSVAELILGGVLERFQKMKVLLMESDVGWVPWLLQRMDEKWETYGPDLDYSLPLKPSDYFKRQCYMVMEPEDDLVNNVIARLGDKSILFSGDYPHHDSAWPYAVSNVLGRKDLSDETKGNILWNNSRDFFGWK